MTEAVDIAIVGGGMVGASLAVALGALGVSVSLIESVPPGTDQPSFDERTTALSNGSRRILETLGVWPAIAAATTPIRKIHVSDRGHFGFARIDAAEQGLDALGYVVPNRVFGAALWSRIAGMPCISARCPADVLDAKVVGEHVELSVGDGPGSALSARLIVAADGARSAVRELFGIAAEVRDYEQTALTTTVLPQRFHDHIAYERFTEEGPLALLPLADGRCTLVLTLTPATAAAAIGWSDREFLDEVQRRFGFRLGRFLQVGRRVAYPLSLTRSTRTSAERCVVVGNAAQGLHPVAGMGFNLGLRDAASLAELVADARAAGVADLGNAQLLREYDAWRAADRRGIIGFTDGLVRVFSHRSRVAQRLRNAGLLAFDLLPAAKSALSRLSTGAAGRVPKLARGEALS
ncbi:MAG: 2-octaprenyl-6-methoxyphenyl hydroxylase [Steroidobacteraceae bacterium]